MSLPLTTLSLIHIYIGHKLNEFDKFSDSLSTIAGIFKNFPLNSLEEEIDSQQISIGTEQDLIQKGKFIQIKLIPEYYKETLVSIEKLWKEMNGDRLSLIHIYI